MKKFFLLFLLGSLLLMTACVSAPRQTVELAEIVDSQIAEMQLSHEKFVRLYYQKCRDEIDLFLVEKWIPKFLSNIISGKGDAGKQFRSDLNVAYTLSEFDWNEAINTDSLDNDLKKEAVLKTFEDIAQKNNATLGKVLIDFSEGAQKEINLQRKELMKPINEQEAFVLKELRDSYSDLLRGSASIKGYLASTVELVEQQDEVLSKLSVLDDKKKIIDEAVKINDRAIDLIDKVEDADEGVKKFLSFMEDAKEKIAKLKGEGD
jgi:hypothetical protein